MNKTIKHFLFLSTITAGCMYGINQFVDAASEVRHLLSKQNGHFFEWRYGTIFYTKQGSGSPLLLIHDLHPAASSAEWNSMIHYLEQEHTVYTLDLLGCGRSDKPALTYTNYLYVQLVTDFVKSVMKEKTDVVATGSSCSFTIMAANLDDTIFHRLFLISPVSLTRLQQNPSGKNNIWKYLPGLPVLGTFFYHLQMTEKNIADLFDTEYDCKTSISGKIKDIYYESAHAGHSRGKFLLSSIVGNYTNINIIPALKKIENPIVLIGSSDRDESAGIINSYIKYDETIETAYIADCGRLPQLEAPEKLYEIFRMFCE